MTKLLKKIRRFWRRKKRRNPNFIKIVIAGTLFPAILLLSSFFLLRDYSDKDKVAMDNIMINWEDCNKKYYESELEVFFKRLILEKKILKEPKVSCTSDLVSGVRQSKLNTNGERIVTILAEENKNKDIKKLVILFEHKQDEFSMLYPIIDCKDCKKVCFYSSYQDYKQAYNGGVNEEEIKMLESGKDVYIVVEGLANNHNVFKI